MLPFTDRPGAVPTVVLASAALLDGGFRLAIECPLPDRLALVVELLAAGESELDLQPVPLGADGQWYDREALFRHLAGESSSLSPVQQQLAAPERIVVGVAGVVIRSDVDRDEPRLSSFEGDVAILER